MTLDNCNTGSWTLRFSEIPGSSGPFEIRPLRLDYKQKRRNLNYAKATCDPAVGEMMKPETGRLGGRLRVPTRVETIYDGEQVGSLYFRPDFAEYGSDYTHIELHDLQKLLKSGVVDNEWSSVKPKDAYKYAFGKSKDFGIIRGLKFRTPDNFPDRLVVDPLAPNPLSEAVRDLTGETERVINSWNSINFDQITPLDAIWQLNKILGLASWVGPDQYLWVGIPEASRVKHVAAPDDSRVWRYNAKEVNIRHPREPIKKLTVHGAWNDSPGEPVTTDVIDDAIDFFTTDQSVKGDIRVSGIAERTDVPDGKSVLVESPNAKKDAVENIAKSVLLEKYRNSHAGSVEIDPGTSGAYTPLHGVQPGDKLHLVPDDSHFENPSEEAGQIGDGPSADELDSCSSFVNNEVYTIREVQHYVDDNGYWSVTLDVAIEPDPRAIDTMMRYFDPEGGAYMDEKEVYGLG